MWNKSGKNAVLNIDPSLRPEVVERLVRESSPRKVFMLMMLISVVVTTIGLLNDSVSVVLGGMLVAPLLSPVIGVAMGIVTADAPLIRFASWTIFLSIVLAIGTSIIITLFHLPMEMTAEILERTEVIFMLPVAIAAGAAASIAMVHKEQVVILPGVAIAVALIPPLSVTGIGIAARELFLIQRSLELFLVNLIGIIFVCVVVFSLMGFAREKEEAEVAVEEEIKALEND